MIKFNKTIQVQVEIDEIANKLLSTINADEKHRELIAEAVIGSLLVKSDNGIALLYGALNGFTNQIDFEIDEEVMCTDKMYSYSGDKEEYTEMGLVKVKSIDLYADKKLKVEYQHTNSKGEQTTKTATVDHRNCSKIACLAH